MLSRDKSLSLYHKIIRNGHSKKTWFVTGASRGIGLILVKQLLVDGYNVVATARDLEKLQNAVGVTSLQFLPLQASLPDEKSVQLAVDSGILHFGSIDVVVNNAGYGLIGAIEESSAKEVQASFDINVFGLLNVTRAVLPYMRSAKSGHIFKSVFHLWFDCGQRLGHLLRNQVCCRRHF